MTTPRIRAYGTTRTALLTLAAALALCAGRTGAQERIAPDSFTYKVVDGVALRADVYRARDDVVRPVVIWLHGGALIMGSRHAPDARILGPLLDDGWVIVSVDYRLAPGTSLPDILQDVVDAHRWIYERGSELFHADSSRIAVMGSSAGGYLTLAMGYLARPRPTALVSLYGYGDLTGAWYSQPTYLQARHVSEAEAFEGVDPGIVTDGRGRERSDLYLYTRQNGLWPELVTGHDPVSDSSYFFPYEPVRNVTGDYPPTLMLHGTADTDVPHAESVLMARELERHGVTHRLITLEGSEHNLRDGDLEQVARAYAEVVPFLDRMVKDRGR